MRLLLCSTGLAGHFNPLVPFIDAARDRGDEVFVVVPPSLAAEVQTLGVAHYLSDPPDPDEVERALATRGAAAARAGARDSWTASSSADSRPRRCSRPSSRRATPLNRT